MSLSSYAGPDKTRVNVVTFPRATPPTDVEVLIVGAGPSGLGTALELQRHGIEVAVVDSATEATLVRAGAAGVSARTVEIFRTWGVAERVRESWTVPPEWNKGNILVTSVVGHVLGGNVPDAFSRRTGSPISREDGVRRPQTVFQQVFLDRLAELDVTVAAGWRVEGLEQDADGVTTTVVDIESGEKRSIRSTYVIGADGSKSTVRNLAGITRTGEYATERHWRYVVRTKGGVPAELGAAPSASNIIFNNDYSGFISAINETDWRAYAGPFALDHVPTEDELISAAKKGFGFDVDLEIVSLTSYFKSTRISDEFVRGRVALVGDAAHVRTPGGNLSEGFGDVANLGWKLAAVLRGFGGERLLASYDEERRIHNWRVADHALERSIANDEALAKIRAIGVPHDDDTSPEAVDLRVQIGAIIARDFAFALGVVFDERYDASSVVVYDAEQFDTDPQWTPSVYVDDARPGHRAPNGAIETGGVTLYGRLGSWPTLFVLNDDTSAVAQFTAAAASRSVPLDVVYLTEPEVRSLYASDYVIVRPDHHVAWRGIGHDFDAAAVIDTIYGRDAAADADADASGASESEKVLEAAEA
ncbi:FAD-dependent monooxygenase [Subtercola lobariae]|uniref:Monooxygenase n=1 Tax=Subtercola lobariae TaxID=1588641 RepID=A0A917B5X3_9MICO|nr:FAD-dependent monooxygenase [Subtercola lobariae]GGF22180.1 monooxygenase [Subtercola lobariae]